MRKGGFEPPQPCGYRILSPARLPVPPLSRVPGELDGVQPDNPYSVTQESVWAWHLGRFLRCLVACLGNSYAGPRAGASNRPGNGQTYLLVLYESLTRYVDRSAHGSYASLDQTTISRYFAAIGER